MESLALLIVGWPQSATQAHSDAAPAVPSCARLLRHHHSCRACSLTTTCACCACCAVPRHAVPAVQAQATISNVPLGAIPNYGGKTSEGTNATHHRWGVDRVPTPREIVAHLDQYVVGQVSRSTKRGGAGSVCGGGRKAGES